MAIVQRIVEEVADQEGVSPVELPPLYEYLDTEALRALVDSMDDGSLEIEFVYDGYAVTVYGDGRVHVEETATRS